MKADLFQEIFIIDSENQYEAQLVQQCFDIVSLFVTAIDLNGKITFANKYGCQLLNTVQHEIKGKQLINDFIVTNQQQSIQQAFNNIIHSNESAPHKLMLTVKANGNTKTIETKPVIIRNKNNQIVGILLPGKDVTNYLNKQNNLQNAKSEAENANHAKTDFLARVSHEIRTPLNAILGFTEQLKQSTLNEQQREFLKIIDKSSEHLLSLINDILVLSKVEASQFSFDQVPFKLSTTLKYVHEALKVKAEEKNLRFHYHIDQSADLVLIGDNFRLRQILMNLISNAIKFTSQGYVETRCFIKHETKSEVQIRFDIIDTGIGIDHDKLKAVFNEFTQANSAITKKYGGTGLGLTICKKLIEMQNGSLTVSSQQNVGSTFSFVLPFKKGDKNQVINEESYNVNYNKLKGKHMLLVDDDSVNRLLAITILKKFHCTFDIAIHGNEAIEKLRNHSFDAVLLDIHLPDISGLDVAKQFRYTMGNKQTPIIAVTAAAMTNGFKRYKEAGINDFLVKPFKEINLYNKICEVLKIITHQPETPKAEIILKEDIQPKMYDLSELKNIAGNSQGFISNMLQTFILNSRNTIDNFNTLVQKNDWKQVAETAHKVLPSFRHLQVHPVTKILEKIKNEGFQANPDANKLTRLTEQVNDKISHLIGKLQNEIASNK